jgi:hypothetical protein
MNFDEFSTESDEQVLDFTEDDDHDLGSDEIYHALR